ncbi:PIN domain-containing protein [soil metagenome]
MSKIFIDTKIFVYSIDDRDLEKKAGARQILHALPAKHQPIISTQVVQELYAVATTKLKAEPFIVKQLVHSFRRMEIVNIDLDLIEQAIDINLILQISFWDSLIIAAAEKALCKYVYSEDLASGASYRGVMVLNPFMETEI